MRAIRKPLDVWCSTRATLASPTSIDGQEPSSGTFSLIRKFLKECRPSCVVYRFRKPSTRQTFYVQVFDKNYSVVVDDLSGQLVLKIVASVENFTVNLGYQANRFLPALGKLLATCYSTLCSAKALLCLLEQTRISNSRSVVPPSRTTTARHPDPRPYRSLAVVQLYDATETGIPHAVLTFDGERLDLALDRTVQLNVDVANLRKRQPAAELEPGLRIGEGVVAALGAKAGKPRYLSTLATKEQGLKSFVDTAKRILQNLTVHRTKILSNGFDVWELVSLLNVVDALAVRRPRLTTLLQGRVIQFSTPRAWPAISLVAGDWGTGDI